MRDQRFDHGGGAIGLVHDDIDDVLRQAGIAQQFADHLVRARTSLGRLQDHGVAARQRHDDDAQAQQQRCVPRRDAERDAERAGRPAARTSPSQPTPRAMRTYWDVNSNAKS